MNERELKRQCHECKRIAATKHLGAPGVRRKVTHELIHVAIGKRSLRLKFATRKRGAGFSTSLKNPGLLEAVGEWFLNEIDALPEEP